MASKITREQLIKKVRVCLNGIQPRPSIGDDDSIYLTDFQEGQKNALIFVLKLLTTNTP